MDTPRRGERFIPRVAKSLDSDGRNRSERIRFKRTNTVITSFDCCCLLKVNNIENNECTFFFYVDRFEFNAAPDRVRVSSRDLFANRYIDETHTTINYYDNAL